MVWATNGEALLVPGLLTLLEAPHSRNCKLPLREERQPAAHAPFYQRAPCQQARGLLRI